VKTEPIAFEDGFGDEIFRGMSSMPVAWRLASSRRSSAICGSTESSGRFMRSLASVVRVISDVLGGEVEALGVETVYLAGAKQARAAYLEALKRFLCELFCQNRAYPPPPFFA